MWHSVGPLQTMSVHASTAQSKLYHDYDLSYGSQLLLFTTPQLSKCSKHVLGLHDLHYAHGSGAVHF